jgi:hypothetical protein
MFWRGNLTEGNMNNMGRETAYRCRRLSQLHAQQRFQEQTVVDCRELGMSGEQAGNTHTSAKHETLQPRVRYMSENSHHSWSISRSCCDRSKPVDCIAARKQAGSERPSFTKSEKKCPDSKTLTQHQHRRLQRTQFSS